MEASGIHVTFNSINSTAYDVSSLTLAEGQQIFMSIPSIEGDTNWFATNDPVLSIVPGNNFATIMADAEGVSIIQIQDSDFNLIKKITITVVGTQAASLGITAGAPEPK